MRAKHEAAWDLHIGRALRQQESNGELPPQSKQTATKPKRPLTPAQAAWIATRKARAVARRLLREQLEYGPRPAAQVERVLQAAAVDKRVLLDAADELGVRTRCGQWWLPTSA